LAKAVAAAPATIPELERSADRLQSLPSAPLYSLVKEQA
jgi:hypothetical protein